MLWLIVSQCLKLNRPWRAIWFKQVPNIITWWAVFTGGVSLRRLRADFRTEKVHHCVSTWRKTSSLCNVACDLFIQFSFPAVKYRPFYEMSQTGLQWRISIFRKTLVTKCSSPDHKISGELKSCNSFWMYPPIWTSLLAAMDDDIENTSMGIMYFGKTRFVYPTIIKITITLSNSFLIFRPNRERGSPSLVLLFGDFS